MKTYEQLTPNQQKKAVEREVNNLLNLICNGGLRFDDKLNHDRLQARIDAASKKAEDMQTPWFWAEYIREDAYIMERLESMAQCSAENALYSSKEEYIQPEPEE
jgi:hypothetical protein